MMPKTPRSPSARDFSGVFARVSLSSSGNGGSNVDQTDETRGDTSFLGNSLHNCRPWMIGGKILPMKSVSK